MPDINKVILIGNLGADPISHSKNDNTLAHFSLATTARWKDSTGTKQERTDWHKIVLFNRLAEIAAQYLKTGSKVYVEGRLQTRKWQKDDGTEQYSTEIVGNVLKFLDKKETNSPQHQQAPQPEYEYNNYFTAEDEVPF